MGSVKAKLLATAAAAVVISTAAGAADLPPPMPPAIYTAPAEDFGGWYLRGDIGFSNQRIKNVEFVPGPTLPALTSQETLSVGADAAGIFGLGIGYQYNWFRFDVTGEYRGNAHFRSNNRHHFRRRHVPRAELRQQVRVGGARQRLRGSRHLVVHHAVHRRRHRRRLQHDQQFPRYRRPNAAPTTSACDRAASGTMAWALHAGLAYKVTPNFTHRAGLSLSQSRQRRDRHPDRMATGTFQGEKERINGLISHDLKLGVRWLLKPAPEPVAPPPLMRKG